MPRILPTLLRIMIALESARSGRNFSENEPVRDGQSLLANDLESISVRDPGNGLAKIDIYSMVWNIYIVCLSMESDIRVIKIQRDNNSSA